MGPPALRGLLTMGRKPISAFGRLLPPPRSPFLNPPQPPKSYFNKQALPSITEDAETAMAARRTLSPEQRRLLRITGRMPLASVSDLAPVLDMSEERVGRMLRTLKSGGWAEVFIEGHDRPSPASLVPELQGRG